MTFDSFIVWSNLCRSCCGNTGRLLHDICKYADEQIVAHLPLVFICQRKQVLTFHVNCLHMKCQNLFSLKIEEINLESHWDPG